MTSSRLDPSTRTTGAHRAHRRAPSHAAGSGARSGHTLSHHPPARHEAHLDGLFTYCLSVLCDHDTAAAVLGDVLALAERHRGRCPDDEAGRRTWLYALARWACLRSLDERRHKRHGAHTGRPAETPPRVSEETAEEHRAELARLAWPEAAGTTPEQREALELAVRHGLGPREVAAVLSLDQLAARELLSSAACEVERTRAALAVVETGACPTVARLTGDHQVRLSATLRAELVRHVDDCPLCRRAAERAGAGGPWPGTPVASPARLPLVEAPRAAVHVAMLHAPRTRATAPRFGATGFPMDPKDHAARRDRMRARAVTTTVVAAVVAAPVLALWASYRGTPEGEAVAGTPATAREAEAASTGVDGAPDDHYESAGNARTTPDARSTGGGSPDVSVELVSAGEGTEPSRPGQPGPGRLAVTARGDGTTTLLTLTNSGGSPATWSLWTDAPWLFVSRASGTLAPGESVTVRIAVDHTREPAGAWSARVGVKPSGAMLRITGHGTRTAPPATEEPAPTTDPTSPPPATEEPPPATEEPSPTTDPTSPPPVTEEPSPSGEPTSSADPDTPDESRP